MLNSNLFHMIHKKLEENELSINALYKSLKEDGYKLHKLDIRGYLRALEDLGYVEERSVPPAKVFKLKHVKAVESIYEIVGKHVKRISNERDEGELTIDALGMVLKRPVFKEELRRCNVNTVHVKREAKKDEELRTVLNRNGYGIPEGDVCYEYEEQCRSAELLGSIIGEIMNVKIVSAKMKQRRLEEV